MSELQKITVRMEEMGVKKKRFYPLQRNSTKTGKEIMSEMFSCLETLKEKEGNMSKEIEKSNFNDWLDSLIRGNEETVEGAMNDEDEITELEMNSMLSKLRQRSRREFCMFRTSAIYTRYRWKFDQRHYGECARKGLAVFNERNGTGFVMDRSTCRQNWQLYRCQFYYLHLNFEATDEGSKETCVFFAEVRGYRDMDVTICCKLRTGDGKTKTRCEICKPKHGISHPTDVALPFPPDPSHPYY